MNYQNYQNLDVLVVGVKETFIRAKPSDSQFRQQPM